MPYNIILYFRLPYFHVSNIALFSTKYISTLILYRRSLDTFYLQNMDWAHANTNHTRVALCSSPLAWRLISYNVLPAHCFWAISRLIQHDNYRCPSVKCVLSPHPGPTFIKPDQRNPWIKDQLWNDLLSTILHLQLPNFVSCGRDKPSHMTQNLVTVGMKL